jgi:membrane-bound metal-dependent hydrolase YbcI (DUF457 family)
MDIVSHALAGAAAGVPFNRPILGAFFGVLPDIVIAGKRRELPSKLYDFTHSLLGIGLFGLAGTYITGSLAPLVAILSHLLLDLPTHGDKWAPPLLYPFDSMRFSYGEEWEWFNIEWWRGALLTLLWITICFNFALAIGSL